MMSQQNARLRHNIYALLAVVAILCVAGNVGYAWRRAEDQGLAETLITRIKAARTDERAICSDQKATQTIASDKVLAEVRLAAKNRDAQVATLIGQNRVLMDIMRQGQGSREEALAQAREAARAASRAVAVAGVAASAAVETNKRLDTATYSKAVPPPMRK